MEVKSVGQGLRAAGCRWVMCMAQVPNGGEMLAITAPTDQLHSTTNIRQRTAALAGAFPEAGYSHYFLSHDV